MVLKLNIHANDLHRKAPSMLYFDPQTSQKHLHEVLMGLRTEGVFYCKSLFSIQIFFKKVTHPQKMSHQIISQFSEINKLLSEIFSELKTQRTRFFSKISSTNEQKRIFRALLKIQLIVYNIKYFLFAFHL